MVIMWFLVKLLKVDLVKKIESCGTQPGKPKTEVFITDCGQL